MTVTHEDLGLYLLGKLDPADRLAFDEHLAGCAACRDELAQLSGVRSLLGTVTAQDATSELPPAPPAILPALLSAAATDRARERRRRRLIVSGGGALATAGAAAAAVVLLTGGGPGASAPPAPQVRVVALHGAGAAGHLELTPNAWGSDLTLTLDGLPHGEHCSLVLVAADGSRQEVSTWTADYEGTAAIHAHTDLAPAEAKQVRIEEVGTHTLLLQS